jgi:formate/nitrite transporter FocA (FNT family)
MRSETAPTWVGFALGLGIMLWVAVGAALVTGKVALTKTKAIEKAEQPEAFWMLVILMAVIGSIAFLYGAAHFGPGG